MASIVWNVDFRFGRAGRPRPAANQAYTRTALSLRAKARDFAGANTNASERYASNTYLRLYVMRRSEGEPPYRRLRRQIRLKTSKQYRDRVTNVKAFPLGGRWHECERKRAE